MKRIYLIDCPGIVPPEKVSDADILLRGVVRTEKVEDPAQYVTHVVSKVKKHHLARTYDIEDWKDADDFLELLAKKRNMLRKGGEPDLHRAARNVLDDFLRGRIPWFTPPPAMEGDQDAAMEGRQGRLGEMPIKRKLDDVEGATDMAKVTKMAKTGETTEKQHVPEDDEEDFEGFGSESAPELDSSDDENASDVMSLGVSSEEDEDDCSTDEEEEGNDENEDDHDEINDDEGDSLPDIYGDEDE
jgi:nuclear GTP-binding protein